MRYARVEIRVKCRIFKLFPYGESNLNNGNYDILIVVALKEEMEYLISVFHEFGISTGQSENDGMFVKCRYTTGLKEYSIAIYCIDGQGSHAVWNSDLENVLADISPAIVVNIGISGKTSADVSYGSVVVPSTIFGYSANMKVSEEGGEVVFGFSGAPSNPDRNTHVKVKNFTKSGRRKYNEWVDACQTALARIGAEKGISSKLLNSLSTPSVNTKDPIACGDVVSASDKFVKSIKNIDRKIVCVDQESNPIGNLIGKFDVENRVNYAVFRGISDPATTGKNDTEDQFSGILRRWAMYNAVSLFLKTIDLIFGGEADLEELGGFDDTVNCLHTLTASKHLESPFHTLEYFTQVGFEKLDELIDLFSSKEGCKSVDQVCQAVLESKETLAYGIMGEHGTAKSYLMSGLFWKLFLGLKKDKDWYVFYINLKQYTNPSNTFIEMNTTERNAAEFEHLLNIIANLYKKRRDQKFIFLIDGLDNYVDFKTYGTSLIEKVSESHKAKIIVGVKTSPFGISNPIYQEPSSHLKTCAIDTSDLESLSKYISIFLSLEPAHKTIPDIKIIVDVIRRMRLLKFDYFLFRRIIELPSLTESEPQNISSLIYRYNDRRLKKSGILNEKKPDQCQYTKTVAFQSRVQESHELGVSNNPLIHLIRSHDLVEDYFAARYIIDTFCEIGIRGKAEISRNQLNYVYPQNIGRMCKEIIENEPSLIRHLVDGIRFTIESPKPSMYMKAEAAYLAGRVSITQYIPEVEEILKKALELSILEAEKAEGDVSTNAALMLQRTSYISLSYLGDRERKIEYVEKLLLDPKTDSLNRGFHQEYYQDKEFIPSKPLVGEDNGDPCPRTISEILHRLKNKRENILFEIELQTLFSLIFRQHRNGIDISNYIEDLKPLIDEFRENGLYPTKIENLNAYIESTLKYIEKNINVDSTILMEIYSSKAHKRTGWVKRNVPEPESIADHIFSVSLLAILFLPEKNRKGDLIDRFKIAQMLLVHDLPETRWGDFDRDISIHEKTRKEQSYFNELLILNSISNLQNQNELCELFEEFDAGQTLNAKIAHDLDKIDSLIQLEIYSDKGVEIEDRTDWIQEILGEIKTDEGRWVLDIVKTTFPNIPSS